MFCTRTSRERKVMTYKLYKAQKIRNIREMLERSAALYGPKPAFYQKVDKVYKPISFTRFYEDVCSLGAELVNEGLAGKRIMLLGENCYSWCLSYMTVVCGLGVIVPVDKDLPAEEIDNIARISEASAIIYSSKYAEKIAALEPSITRISFAELGEKIIAGAELVSDDDRRYAELSISIDAMTALIFTSGTTGVSKGVMLSQRNICTNIHNLAKMIKIDPAVDIDLCILPLHHVYECNCGFLYSIYTGCSYAFSEGIRYVTKNMKEIRPTKMLCVPLLIETMYKKIWASIRKKGIEEKVKNIIKITDAIQPYSARMAVKRKLFSEIHENLGGRINLLVSGGAPINPDVIKGMQAFGFRVIQGYGLTECSPLAAVNHDSYFNNKSAGLALPEGELDIVNPSEDGSGEIRYRGDNVMLGYFGRKDLTDEVIKNGWLYTGDIGYIDEKGFLVITGRKKNVIVTANGKNIFPEELEMYLGRSPFVDEAVVVGIMNEKKKDYDIVAIVRPDNERAAEILGEAMSDEKVESAILAAVDEVNATVQSYKRIGITIVTNDEFPKNSSRKIKRMGIIDWIYDKYLEKLN